MLNRERKYQFRDRIDVVHQPRQNDSGLAFQPDETVIDSSWQISCPAGSPAPVEETVKDLADYLRVSMGITVPVNFAGNSGIFLNLDSASDLAPGAFELSVSENAVTITASSTGGIRRGGVYLEDLMNLRGAPALKQGSVKREKLISPRIVHSGWGIELFPDSHLNAIMHAGFDAIAVFCRGENQTNIGYLDFNDLIRRAKNYDIEVYLYAYLPSFKHPDDADAEAFFENVYTKLLQKWRYICHRITTKAGIVHFFVCEITFSISGGKNLFADSVSTL